jgi:choline monooxygenase
MSQIARSGPLAAFDTDPSRSRTLPGPYYHDPAIFRRETTAIFHATWQYVGHVAMLPEPGSYIVRDILDQSVAIVRGADGVIRAFFNVCQHRAHRLLEGEGNVKAVITCPYHAWSYGLDGALRTARGAERMARFDPSAFCLSSVALGEMLGFLFVNLDGKAPPFDAVTGALRAEIAAFSPDAAKLLCAHRNEFPLKANWKNSVENYDECFHCPVQHQSLITEALDYASYRVVTHEHHHSHTSRAPDKRRYSTVTEGAAKPDAFASWLLFPNWCIEAYPGGNLTVFHHVPLGPERTVQRCEWYFPHATPTAVEREVIDFVDTVRAEDIPICESVQNGLHSLGYRRGAFVVDAARSEVSEHAVHDFQLKVLRALGEAG